MPNVQPDCLVVCFRFLILSLRLSLSIFSSLAVTTCVYDHGEAIVALSIAANIAQFIDLGRKFVTEARKIYQDGKNNNASTPDLHKTTTALQRLLKDLQSAPEENEEPSENEQSICQLSRQCQDVATELLVSLNKIYLPGKPRRRDALKGAWMSTWKYEDIKLLHSKLNDFQQLLSLHLLASLRIQAQRSIDQQGEVLSHLKATQTNTAELHQLASKVEFSAEGIGVTFLNILASKVDPSYQKAAKWDWQRILTQETYQEGENARKNIPAPLISDDRQKRLRSVFLTRFSYRGMKDREEGIPKAHEKTFQWIYQNNEPHGKRWHSFRDWLESDDSLYWITGKPGSGKSTLMKFICLTLSSNTGPGALPHVKHLARWAGNSKLITAAFYFWSSGNCHANVTTWTSLLSLAPTS